MASFFCSTTGKFHILRSILLTCALTLWTGCDGYSMSAPSTGTPEQPLEETSDRLERWHGRWDQLNLGWHQGDVHPSLLKYEDRLLVGGGGGDSCPDKDDGKMRWFFPLCGKTVDMAYLAGKTGTSQVVGVDGIRKALDEFAKDHPDLELKPDTPIGQHERLVGRSITLLKGDFFALNADITGGKFDAVMDRGSMVAIDPALREEYVATLSRLVQPGGRILLVTVDKRAGDEEALVKGPPFSIPEAEVRRLYEGRDWVKSVTLLEQVDEFLMDPDSRFKKEGVTSMFELSFLIETTSSTVSK